MRGDPLPTAQQIRACSEMFPFPPPDLTLREAMECSEALQLLGPKLEAWAKVFNPSRDEDEE